MLKINIYLFIFFLIILVRCNSEEHQYPIDKRYWETSDYEKVIRILKYHIKPDEKLPNYKDADTRVVIEKLVDEQNYKIVLDDDKLGIKHRNAVGNEFFQQWRNLYPIYQVRDRTDAYIYDIEMLKIAQFGLGLQLRYFKLGNDVIMENADDPDSKRVKNGMSSNIRTLIGNFDLYLDYINDEKSFSPEGKKVLADGIDKYFTRLIELYPRADYRSTEKKIDLLYQKSESDSIKKSLDTIKKLIRSKNESEPIL